MPGNFSDWAPYTNFVQSGMDDGRYINAGFTMLAAGPPRLANIGGAAAVAGAVKGGQAANNIVFPIGCIQNFGLNNNRGFQRVWEIGSERSYFIGGRTQGSLNLSRVHYHGASLLRVLYAYYEDLIPPTIVNAMWPNAGAKAMANPHDVIIPPGYENIYINLASDLFAQPTGMLLYMRDINQATLGAVYFESCYVPNHNWQTDAQGVLVQEQVGIQYERIVPVEVGALTLITNSGMSNSGGANATFPGIVNS